MSETETTQESMQRIRANLSRRRRGEASRSVPFRMRAQADLGDESLRGPQPTAVADFPALDLSPLRIEVEGALAGHKMVGQLNPRQPGIHNRAVQFVKRAMLRVMTFYTRPLHYFQSSTIRALQNTMVAIKTHDDELQELKRGLGRQSAALGEAGRQSQATFKAAQAASQRAAAAEEKLEKQVTAAEEKLERQIAFVEERLRDLPAEQGRLAEELARFAQAAQAQREETRRLEALLENYEQRLTTSVESQEQRLAGIWNSLDQKHAAISDSFNERLSALSGDVEARHDNLLGRVEAHETRLADIPPQLERLIPAVGEVARLRAEMEGFRSLLQEMAMQARLHDRDQRRYVNELLGGKKGAEPAAAERPVPAMFAAGEKGEGSFDYFRFEELYRGDEALIAERQKEYLEYFRGRDNVADLGCGRGEFLALLRENGIRAKGVELGADQYLLCKEKGLDVLQQDLFEFLEGAQDGSLGGIFSAQVIEHLTASDQLRLVGLAYRKTAPGSPVIFETINAQSVFAVVRNFFLDPTHVRPVHPETLKIAMESAKFRDVELKFSSAYMEKRIPALELGSEGPDTSEFNRATSALNELVYGYLDYAAIGWH